MRASHLSTCYLNATFSLPKHSVCCYLFLSLFISLSLSLSLAISAFWFSLSRCAPAFSNISTAGTGSPQLTVISLYRYIEAEMARLGLFDNRKPQGGGLPDMFDGSSAAPPAPGETPTRAGRRWDELRNHIETYIFQRIYARTKAMGPVLCDYANHFLMDDFGEEDDNDASSRGGGGSVSGAVAKPKPKESLNMKLASLSFASMKTLGLASKSKDSDDTSSDSCSSSVSLPHEQEWHLAVKEFARSLEMKTPGKVLKKMVEAVKLITHVLDAHLNSRSSRLDSFKCLLCSRSHVLTALPCDEDARVGVGSRGLTVGRSDATLCLLHCDGGKGGGLNGDAFMRKVMAPSAVRKLASVNRVGHGDRGDNAETVAVARGEPDDSDEEDDEEGAREQTISADDLLPALAWIIIQANPPNIDTVFWMCSEFRHPELLHGEEEYCLSQLSSALEFLRRASPQSLDLPEAEYTAAVAQYQATLRLLISCKRGDLGGISASLAMGANVNGFTPDQQDTALTACIRFNRTRALELILAQPFLNVNAVVSPYHGEVQQVTALAVASKFGRLQMVLALLAKGANRYLADSEGNTPLSLSVSEEHRETHRVLMALPELHDLLVCVASDQEDIVVGLLLQGVCPDKLYGNGTRTPLTAAIAGLNVNLVRSLLSLGKADANYTSNECCCERPLLFTARRFVECAERVLLGEETDDYIGRLCDEMETLVQLAAMLIRAGADKSLAASDGSTALSLLTVLECRVTDSSVRAPHPKVQSVAGVPVAAVWMDTTVERVGVVSTDLNRFLALLRHSTSSASLFEMAEHGDMAGAWALIAMGIDVNTRCPSRGFNAVIATAFRGDHDMLDLLLKAAKISGDTNFEWVNNFRSEDGELDTAMEEGGLAGSGEEGGLDGSGEESVQSFFAMRKLKKVPALDLNQTGRRGWTALHFAAQRGDAIMVGHLLHSGANRNPITTDGDTPLDIAKRLGHQDAIDVLRYVPEKVSICLAARHGDWVVMSALLRQGVSINLRKPVAIADFPVSELHDMFSPLIAAVAYSQSELVEKILNVPLLEIDITNQRGSTALIYAATAGDESLVLMLLSKGADRYIKDATGKDAAAYAALKGVASVETILRVDPARTRVHEAIAAGDVTAAIALFKQGIAPNARRYIDDPRYSLPPSSVAGTGLQEPSGQQPPVKMSKRISMALPQLRRVPSAVDVGGAGGDVVDGETPLMVAARYNRLDMIQLLIRAPDIRLDLIDSALGWTALFHAASVGHEDALLLLLKAGAARYVRDVQGDCAADIAFRRNFIGAASLLEADPMRVYIHDACEVGSVHVVHALLQQGCPPNFADERPGKREQTPLMAACTGGKYDVVKLLLGIAEVRAKVDSRDSLGRTALMRGAR